MYCWATTRDHASGETVHKPVHQLYTTLYTNCTPNVHQLYTKRTPILHQSVHQLYTHLYTNCTRTFWECLQYHRKMIVSSPGTPTPLKSARRAINSETVGAPGTVWTPDVLWMDPTDIENGFVHQLYTNRTPNCTPIVHQTVHQLYTKLYTNFTPICTPIRGVFIWCISIIDTSAL
jgi:hypothetical protein